MKKLLFWLLSMLSITSSILAYDVSDFAFNDKWEVILDKVEYKEDVVIVEKIEWTWSNADGIIIKRDDACVSDLWEDMLTVEVQDKLARSVDWDVYEISFIQWISYLWVWWSWWPVSSRWSYEDNPYFRSINTKIINVPLWSVKEKLWSSKRKLWYNTYYSSFVNQRSDSFDKYKILSLKSSCRVLTEKAKIEFDKKKKEYDKEREKYIKEREESIRKVKLEKERTKNTRKTLIDIKKRIYRKNK